MSELIKGNNEPTTTILINTLTYILMFGETYYVNR